MNLWTEQDDPIEWVFEEADRAARPTRVQRTYRRKPCNLHSEPGPEFYRDQDGAEHPVTNELREQWDREGVSLVIRETYVGTCHTAGCEPGKPGSERWLSPTAPAPELTPEPMRTGSHAEDPSTPKTGPRPAPPLFWAL